MKHFAATTAWYLGISSTLALNSAERFGPSVKALVRRTMRPAEGTIDEFVVHPGKVFAVHLRRISDSSRFAVSDAVHSFSGTLTFLGAEWDWHQWNYELSVAGGRLLLRGTCMRSAQTLETRKIVYDHEDRAQVHIVEHFVRTDEATFEALRSDLHHDPR
jgi:hypothetical protein